MEREWSERGGEAVRGRGRPWERPSGGGPRPGTGARVKEHRAELTAQGLPTARAAELPGVAAPQKADPCED
ncbi:hypothetical protein GCM10010424_43670 [Streptomyces lienomycini]